MKYKLICQLIKNGYGDDTCDYCGMSFPCACRGW